MQVRAGGTGEYYGGKGGENTPEGGCGIEKEQEGKSAAEAGDSNFGK